MRDDAKSAWPPVGGETSWSSRLRITGKGSTCQARIHSRPVTMGSASSASDSGWRALAGGWRSIRSPERVRPRRSVCRGQTPKGITVPEQQNDEYGRNKRSQPHGKWRSLCPGVCASHVPDGPVRCGQVNIWELPETGEAVATDDLLADLRRVKRTNLKVQVASRSARNLTFVVLLFCRCLPALFRRGFSPRVLERDNLVEDGVPCLVVAAIGDEVAFSLELEAGAGGGGRQ